MKPLRHFLSSHHLTLICFQIGVSISIVLGFPPGFSESLAESLSVKKTEAGAPEMFEKRSDEHTKKLSEKLTKPSRKREYNLKSSLSLSLENYPEYQSLQSQLEIAALAERNAFVSMLPQIDLKAQHSLLSEDPKTDNTPLVTTLGMSLTETLFDSGKSITSYEIAQWRRKSLEKEVQYKQNQLIFNLTQLYIQYSYSFKLLKARQLQHQFLENQFKTTSQLYLQGLKTRRDFLRFKTQILKSEIELSELKTEIEKKKVDLSRFVGVNISGADDIDFVPFDFSDKANRIPTLSLEETNSLAQWVQQPLYQSLQSQREIATLELSLIDRNVWPELILSMNGQIGSYRNEKSSFGDNKSSIWSANIELKYNLWDWGQRSKERAIAQYKKNIAENEIQNQLLTLNSEMNQIVIDYQQMQKNSQLAQELFDLEQKNMNFLEKEYRNGKVSYLDYMTALDNLSLAQTRWYSNLSQLQITYFNYLYRQGKLYDYFFK